MGIKEKELFQFFESVEDEENLSQFEDPERLRLLKLVSFLDVIYQDLRKRVLSKKGAPFAEDLVIYQVEKKINIPEDIRDIIHGMGILIRKDVDEDFHNQRFTAEYTIILK